MSVMYKEKPVVYLTDYSLYTNHSEDGLPGSKLLILSS